MARKKQTLVTFVLDETGSMSSIKDDTIGGFNTYIDTLKADKNDYSFSLIKFDSNKIEKVHLDVPIADVPHLTADTYRPGAFTPLIDATYKAIKATEEKVAEKKGKPNVLIVVQTDGYENASVEYKASDLALLVKEKTAAGWGFVFLGAGIDAFSQGERLGMAAGQTMTYNRDTSKQAFAAAAHNTAAYGATGMAMSLNFSDEQRGSTGGHFPRGNAGNPLPDPKNTVAAARRKGRGKRSVVDNFSL